MRRLADQRGSVAVMTAASMLVLVSSLALAVDTGHATSRQRSLRGTTDLIALDAARAVGDRYDATFDAQTVAEEFAVETAARNGFDPLAAGNFMSVELGVMDWVTNTFTTPPPGGDAAANAIRIVTRSSVEHSFLPGNTSFEASSIAAIDAQAGIQVGSSLATFDPSATPFDPVLDDMVGASFDANGYDALVNASVTLGDLWLRLGLGSADEVANSDVGMTEMFDATIDALGSQGDAASVAAASELGDARSGLDASSTFTFGEWLEATGFSPNEAAGIRVNVLDLIAASAIVANGTNLIDVTLPLVIPGVSSVRMKLGLVEKPRRVVGPARRNAAGEWVSVARSAQSRMQLELDITRDLVVLGQPIDLRLPLYLETGSARAELTGIDCLTPSHTSPVDVHVTTSAATGHVGVVNDASLLGGSVTVQEAVLGADPLLVEVRASGSTTIAADDENMTFTGPFTEPPPPGARPSQRAGTSVPSLDALATGMTITAYPAPGTGLLVNAAVVANDVRTILQPVIERLDQTLLPALASLPLGLTFGAADVTNTSLNCAIRRLTS